MTFACGFKVYTKYVGGAGTKSIDNYFLLLDLSFFTNTYHLPINTKLISIYPNPVSANSPLTVSRLDNQSGTWKLYSNMGQVIRHGDWGNTQKETISLYDIPPGQYILHYNNGSTMQNEIVIIP